MGLKFAQEQEYTDEDWNEAETEQTQPKFKYVQVTKAMVDKRELNEGDIVIPGIDLTDSSTGQVIFTKNQPYRVYNINPSSTLGGFYIEIAPGKFYLADFRAGGAGPYLYKAYYLGDFPVEQPKSEEETIYGNLLPAIIGLLRILVTKTSMRENDWFRRYEITEGHNIDRAMKTSLLNKMISTGLIASQDMGTYDAYAVSQKGQDLLTDAGVKTEEQ